MQERLLDTGPFFPLRCLSVATRVTLSDPCGGHSPSRGARNATIAYVQDTTSCSGVASMYPEPSCSRRVEPPAKGYIHRHVVCLLRWLQVLR